MHLADIDYLAFRGDSFWHKASALSKLIFAAVVISVVVVTRKPLPLVLTLSFLLALLFMAGVPLIKFGHLLFFPALFGSVFAFSRIGGSWLPVTLVIVKSLTAASALLLLIATTGAPAIFACLRLIFPPLIVDALFITYRSFFILLDELTNLFTALKVKGGYSAANLVLNLRNIAGALGLLLVRSLETGERMYKVLVLRGYQEGLRFGGRWYQPTRYDLGPLLACFLVLAWVVIL
ncbi:MAG: CbiQ family ECF transporter T component [Thermanaeromonas sp.]|uniref:energy-coupling factor transporter transmembrane component T family protein n=1 Tax=Thermanaeromonas sp. TaxID=2003697 RepID=UPI002440BAFB|nr:CbiQ family ECF transporter T component [Thermanaeromonas sp.]MCG0278182.1 CbiQ family ECF transporter T component [Thermanaeromonas sp.]